MIALIMLLMNNESKIITSYQHLCNTQGPEAFKKFYKHLFSQDLNYNDSYLDHLEKPNKFLHSFIWNKLNFLDLNQSILLKLNSNNYFSSLCLPKIYIKSLEEQFELQLHHLLSEIRWLFFVAWNFAKENKIIFSSIYNLLTTKRKLTSDDLFFFDIPPKLNKTNFKDSVFYKLNLHEDSPDLVNVFNNFKTDERTFYQYKFQNSVTPFSLKEQNFKSAKKLFFLYLKLLFRRHHQLGYLIFSELYFSEICKEESLVIFCKNYFQSQSRFNYCPLWAFSNSSINTTLIFYSSNTAEIKFKNKISYIFNATYELLFYKNIVFLEGDINTPKLLKENYNITNANFSHIKFFTWEPSSLKYKATSNSKKKFKLAIFNIEPRILSHNAVIGLNEIYRFDYDVQNKFLQDIVDCSKDLKIDLVYKIKRDQKFLDKKYMDDLYSLSKQTNFELLESETSIEDLVNASNLVISFPYTSASIICPEKSLYYDPTELLDGNDGASQGILLIQNKSDLLQTINLHYNQFFSI
jgi:hypothetical protein